MDVLVQRVVARYLATEDLVAEPGTTYVYQVDKNNQVLYPGEAVLVEAGGKLLRGEVVLGNKSVVTESGASLPSLAIKAEDGNIYDATSSSITKLPQTIPTPRTVNARKMKMYDYDRRPKSSKFEMWLQAVTGKTEGATHVATAPVIKLLVDGEQLGLITEVTVSSTVGQVLPTVKVGVLGGLTQEAFQASSPLLQKSAREVIAKLRRFPTIQLVTPEYLR